MRRSEYRWIRSIGMLSSIPLIILIATVIGLLLGIWLDSKLGTKPWLAIVLTMVGLAAGLYESVKILIETTRDNDNNR